MAGYPGLGRIQDAATREVCKQIFDQLNALKRQATELEARALLRGSPYDAKGERITNLAAAEQGSDALRLSDLQRAINQIRAAFGSGGAVTVDPAGALGGNGAEITPLKVLVDGSTVQIVGNQLTAPGGGGGGITQLTGDGTAGPGSGSVPFTLANSGVSAGTYGDATNVPQVTVDAKGRVTGVANVAITAGSTPAEVLISEATPTGTGTVTFSSIPGTYRDLRVVIRGRGTQAAGETGVTMIFNGDTGANYNRQTMNADFTTLSATSSAGSNSVPVGNLAAGSSPSDRSSSIELRIYDYRGTTFQKQVQGLAGSSDADTAGGQALGVRSATWRSTAAITQIDISLAAGNYVAGTVVSLYGIF